MGRSVLTLVVGLLGGMSIVVQSQPSTVATLSDGAVRGAIAEGVVSRKGIPFAAPPSDSGVVRVARIMLSGPREEGDGYARRFR